VIADQQKNAFTNITMIGRERCKTKVESVFSLSFIHSSDFILIFIQNLELLLCNHNY